MTLQLHANLDPAAHVAIPMRKELPRVAYALALNPGAKFGSMEEQIVLLAERFRQEGSLFVPIFSCDPASDASQFQSRGIEAQCLDLSRFSFRTLWQLRRFLRRQRIDILHWNFLPPLSNPYVWSLSLATPGVCHWFTDHNSRLFPIPRPPRGFTGWLKRTFLRRYARVVCVSRYIEERLIEQGIWSNHVTLLHFINTDRFCPDDAKRQRVRAELKADGKFVLLTVGQLIPEKGHEVALRALAELPERAILWLVGGGPGDAAIREIITDLKLSERVQLLGMQNHVEPFLQAADCFVCPSMWGEAAGLVNIEAQACGTPVIASRIGGIPEYVDDGSSGLLFTPGNHGELASAVCRLMDDAELCQRLSEAARARAVAQFSHGARLAEWLELYRQWKE